MEIRGIAGNNLTLSHLKHIGTIDNIRQGTEFGIEHATNEHDMEIPST